MGAQTWLTGCIIYFVGIGIVVSLFSAAGAFSGVTVPAQAVSSDTIRVSNTTHYSSVPSFSLGRWLKDIFSFFVFNVSITDTASIFYTYQWLIRIIFVYFPLAIFAMSLYYSLPTVSG